MGVFHTLSAGNIGQPLMAAVDISPVAGQTGAAGVAEVGPEDSAGRAAQDRPSADAPIRTATARSHDRGFTLSLSIRYRSHVDV
jgi:hypothetical protein